MLEPYS